MVIYKVQEHLELTQTRLYTSGISPCEQIDLRLWMQLRPFSSLSGRTLHSLSSGYFWMAYSRSFRWRTQISSSSVWHKASDTTNDTHYTFLAASIWFEIWGSWIRVENFDFPEFSFFTFRFFQAISQKNRFFRANFPKNRLFPGKFTKNFYFSCQIFEEFRFFRQFHKKFDFLGKNWLFTAISGQIILFLFQGHHFRTYFLYKI